MKRIFCTHLLFPQPKDASLVLLPSISDGQKVLLNKTGACRHIASERGLQIEGKHSETHKKSQKLFSHATTAMKSCWNPSFGSNPTSSEQKNSVLSTAEPQSRPEASHLEERTYSIFILISAALYFTLYSYFSTFISIYSKICYVFVRVQSKQTMKQKNTLKNRVTDATAVLATGHQPEAVRPPAQPSLRAANCRLGIGKTDQAPLCHSTQRFF